MARRKKISDNMGDLIEALADFRRAESGIRAEYARRAEEQVSKSRDKVLDLMFIKHADSGPSEIANTTGVSRSTVIRWREEFRGRQDDDYPAFTPLSEQEIARNDALIESGDFSEEEIYGVGGKSNQRVEPVAEPKFTFTKERSNEANVDIHAITNRDTGQLIYVIWRDVFAEGESPDDSDPIDRPDWLTDEVLAKAEEVTGLNIPG